MIVIKLQKSFIKCIGCKTKIINNIISKILNEINNCYELFLGSGSILLAVLSLQKIKFIYDINSVVIYINFIY